jgi:transposase
VTRVDAAALHRRLAELTAERNLLSAKADQVARERDLLSAQAAKAARERDEYHALYLKLLEQCRKLELGLLGQKAERLPPEGAQLTMALLQSLMAEQPAASSEPAEPDSGADDESAPSEPTAEPEKKKRAGRRPIPQELPRIDIEVLPPEVERDGTDQYERIGEEVREVIERRRASLVVLRITRGKWVRKDRERNAETEVFTAPPAELPIDRGLAGPGLLADTIVRRFEDHLPANRQESISAREGFGLSRKTICDWHFQLHLVVMPLLVAMWKDALSAPYLCTDATGVLVQAKDRCRRGHFFTLVVPERYILYAYTPRHDSAAIDGILKGYKGYLLADAHIIYDHLYRTGEVIEVACWAHARRYFFKSVESDPARALDALALINGLFEIERKLESVPTGKRRSTRQRESRPIVERFFAWCDAQAPTVLDDTPIARAIGYARNQREALARFLSDPRLPIHNNASENALRRQAVGRANWTFLGSDEGGAVNAAFVSLLATCKLHGVEPWAYLRDLLCLIHDWPASRVLELSPARWQQTRQQQDTQHRLAAHVVRRVTLDSEVAHRQDK